MRKKAITRQSYGRRIDEPLEIARGIGGKYTDLDVVDRSRKEITHVAYYNLAYYYTALTVSHIDRLTCRGPEDVVGLLKRKATNAQKTMKYNLTDDLFNGTASDEIVGLETHFNETADQTLGGLTTADVTSWDNKRANQAGTITIPAIINMAAKCADGYDQTDIIFTDKYIEAYIWGNLLQAQERYTSGKFNMATQLKAVVGIPMLTDHVFETAGDLTGGNMFFVNNDYYYLRIHNGDNMKSWPFQKAIDQFAYSAYWTIALQACSCGRRRQGLIYGITTS